MDFFFVRVKHGNGKPAVDVSVRIVYGFDHDTDEKRTGDEGWVEFINRLGIPGTIWVDGKRMGEHTLSHGRTYTVTL